MGGSVAVKMAVSLRLGAEVMAASTQVGAALAAVRPGLPLTPLPVLLPPLPRLLAPTQTFTGADVGTKPHTIERCGAACSTMSSLCVVANRKP
jgi:hypothetical protein